MASLAEVHNNVLLSNPNAGTWVLRWIGEDIMGFYVDAYPNCIPATFVMYRAYIDGGEPLGVYGGTYDFQGWGAVGTATRSLAFGPVGGVTAGTYEIEVKECQCHIDDWEYPPPYPYSYADVVIDSEASIGAKTIVVGPPDAPTNPTPANGATKVIWDAIFAWTGDTDITGPFIYSYPFWTTEVAEYYYDALHTVYFSTNLSQLTAIRRAYSWPDATYTLRNPNPQYFNLNDYNYVLPYPVSATTIYWQIKTTNEWGETWGPVWSFTTAKQGTPHPVPPFPPPRPDPVIPDPWWIVPPPYPDPGPYVPPYWGPDPFYKATGGGRWNQQLVVSGDNSVWYEGLT